jgi:uncharacterized membrane protein YjgN (DUF898 family)
MIIPTILLQREPEDQNPAAQMPASTRLVARSEALLGLVLKGSLLTILTFGTYRFWYRTALRGYYWRNTQLLGDGFEYTGTGRELFVGFLIATAIFAPVSLFSSALPWFFGPETGTWAAVLFSFLVLPVLLQFFLFRARRYRLARTRYRGLRFAQGGSGWAFVWITFKWLIPTLLTLGIMFPYWRIALERYRMEHTFFGNQPVQFTAKAGPLMRRWIVLLLSAYALILGIGFGIYRWSPHSDPSVDLTFETVAGLAILLTIGIMSIFWCVYRVAEFRHFTAHTHFGAMALTSDAKAGAMACVFAVYFLALLGAFAVLIALITLVGGISAWIALPLLLSFLPVWGILREIVLKKRLWALFAGSITVLNLGALENILAGSAQEAGGVGEAFDSGYDVAG